MRDGVAISNFNEVSYLWRNKLWPDRKSPITATSAITKSGDIDMLLLASQDVQFWKFVVNGGIAGIISGFKTDELSYRVRGLWIDENWRRKGLATHLMDSAINYAAQINCSTVWTLPRLTAWPFYANHGFVQLTEFTRENFEFGPNCFAEYSIFK